MPGVLTAIGGVLTAFAAVITALYSAGIIGNTTPNMSVSTERSPQETVSNKYSVTSQQSSSAINRKDAKETARGVLAAFKGNDFRKLAELSTRNNKTMLLGIAELGSQHQMYIEIHSGWRWQVVSEWDGNIDSVRFRHYVGTHIDEFEADVKFADMELPEIAVVNLKWEDNQWAFDDIHSPDYDIFLEGSVVFKLESAPY